MRKTIFILILGLLCTIIFAEKDYNTAEIKDYYNNVYVILDLNISTAKNMNTLIDTYNGTLIELDNLFISTLNEDQRAKYFDYLHNGQEDKYTNIKYKINLRDYQAQNTDTKKDDNSKNDDKKDDSKKDDSSKDNSQSATTTTTTYNTYVDPWLVPMTVFNMAYFDYLTDYDGGVILNYTNVPPPTVPMKNPPPMAHPEHFAAVHNPAGPPPPPGAKGNLARDIGDKPGPAPAVKQNNKIDMFNARNFGDNPNLRDNNRSGFGGNNQMNMQNRNFNRPMRMGGGRRR